MGDGQCCDSFRWTAMGLSHTYSVYPFSPRPNLPSHPGCHNNPEQSSLSSIAGPCSTSTFKSLTL